MYILANEEEKLANIFPKAHNDEIKALYEAWRRAATGKTFDLRAAKDLASRLIATLQCQRQASDSLEWWIRDITNFLEHRRDNPV